MFQQRYRVFKQRLGWSVADCDGAERDAFDEASPIYLLAYNSDGRLAGSWRFLPTTGPYMLRDVFPALLHGEAAPEHPQICAGSRLAVEARGSRVRIRSALLCAVTDTCIPFHILHLITLSAPTLDRLPPRP